MARVHEIIPFLELVRYLETSVKKPRVCLNVYGLTSVTFSGETNLSSAFPSGVGNAAPLPSEPHHRCCYTHMYSALIELHCSVS